MSGPTLTAFINPSLELKDAPINPAWITGGNPVARNHVLANSTDGSGWTMLWSCTAGEFRWRYSFDETIHFLEGQVTITDSDGTVRHFGPGDMVFFPAGAVADWKIDSYVRKLAVCQNPVPKVLNLQVKIFRRIDKLVHRLARLILSSLADAGLKPASPAPLLSKTVSLLSRKS